MDDLKRQIAERIQKASISISQPVQHSLPQGLQLLRQQMANRQSMEASTQKRTPTAVVEIQNEPEKKEMSNFERQLRYMTEEVQEEQVPKGLQPVVEPIVEDRVPSEFELRLKELTYETVKVEDESDGDSEKEEHVETNLRDAISQNVEMQATLERMQNEHKTTVDSLQDDIKRLSEHLKQEEEEKSALRKSNSVSAEQLEITKKQIQQLQTELIYERNKQQLNSNSLKESFKEENSKLYSDMEQLKQQHQIQLEDKEKEAKSTLYQVQKNFAQEKSSMGDAVRVLSQNNSQLNSELKQLRVQVAGLIEENQKLQVI
jgi:hypothetical protein